jgi:hypothetical protein
MLPVSDVSTRYMYNVPKNYYITPVTRDYTHMSLKYMTKHRGVELLGSEAERRKCYFLE